MLHLQQELILIIQDTFVSRNIRFDPLLITENDLFAENRPYHYEQNSQDQQNLHFNTNNSTEDDLQ